MEVKFIIVVSPLSRLRGVANLLQGLFHVSGGFDLFDPIHFAKDLLAGPAHQSGAANGLLRQALKSSTTPRCLEIHVSVGAILCHSCCAYLMQCQETVNLEEAMEISKEDQKWNEFDLAGMMIKMGPEFDCLGEEQP